MGVVISNGAIPSSKDVTGVSVLEDDESESESAASIDTTSSVVDDRCDFLVVVAMIEEERIPFTLAKAEIAGCCAGADADANFFPCAEFPLVLTENPEAPVTIAFKSQALNIILFMISV